MTLNDLVSYNHKHNYANGEDNRDGTDANWSYNSGVEGFTENKEITENRKLRQRAMMSTLLLSFGTPIIRSGDEFLNTQFGNNNAYCQDNIISYMVWDAIGNEEIANVRFVKNLIRLRRKMGIFNRKGFLPARRRTTNRELKTWRGLRKRQRVYERRLVSNQPEVFVVYGCSARQNVYGHPQCAC